MKPMPWSGRPRRRVQPARRQAASEALEPRVMLAAISWATNSDGFWDLASNWSTGVVPTAADDVVINRGAVHPTITIGSGAQACNSLVSDDSLLINGGSLAVSATFQVNGPLQ